MNAKTKVKDDWRTRAANQTRLAERKMNERPAVSSAAWREHAANQTRLAFGQALLEIGARDTRAVVLSADTQDLARHSQLTSNAYRDRFIEVGIAEQNAIGIAAGLATTGLHPYVCAYAPFITARSMEQVRNDVAYAQPARRYRRGRKRHFAWRCRRHAPCAGGSRTDAQLAEHDRDRARPTPMKLTKRRSQRSTSTGRCTCGWAGGWKNRR